ncbi:MAG: hypothetical protein HY827_04615 [Actinobacteria bacterium]|nr:hypothetical protein [Actinomycetota bacterium]
MTDRSAVSALQHPLICLKVVARLYRLIIMRTNLATTGVPETAAPLTLNEPAGFCSHFELAGVGWDFYDGMMTRFGFPQTCPEGMVCQFAGPVEHGWFMTNVWLTREHSETYFRDTAMPLIQQHMIESGDHPDIEPESLAIEALLLSPDALFFADIGTDAGGVAIGKFGGAPVLLESNATTIERDAYVAEFDRLGLPEIVPDGLIAHLHGFTAAGDWLAQDVWRSSLDAAATAPAITQTARRVNLRRIAVNPRSIPKSPAAR